jgi:hypothetical protein
VDFAFDFDFDKVTENGDVVINDELLTRITEPAHLHTPIFDIILKGRSAAIEINMSQKQMWIK